MPKLKRKFLFCILGFSCFLNILCMPVQANEYKDINEVPVYTVNENGEVVLSEVDAEFLLNLMDENATISPYQVPGPEGDATRISDIKYGTIDRAEIAGNVMFLVADFTWYKYGGKIINAISKSVFARYSWDSAVRDVSKSLINHFASGKLRTSYTAGYTYKTWNTYHGCYDIHYTEAQYSDPGRTKLEYFVDFPVGVAGLNQ